VRLLTLAIASHHRTSAAHLHSLSSPLNHPLVGRSERVSPSVSSVAPSIRATQICQASTESRHDGTDPRNEPVHAAVPGWPVIGSSIRRDWDWVAASAVGPVQSPAGAGGYVTLIGSGMVAGISGVQMGPGGNGVAPDALRHELLRQVLGELRIAAFEVA
jgi:hypothetical protein